MLVREVHQHEFWTVLWKTEKTDRFGKWHIKKGANDTISGWYIDTTTQRIVLTWYRRQFTYHLRELLRRKGFRRRCRKQKNAQFDPVESLLWAYAYINGSTGAFQTYWWLADLFVMPEIGVPTTQTMSKRRSHRDAPIFVRRHDAYHIDSIKWCQIRNRPNLSAILNIFTDYTDNCR
jgi:hypothetical protein